jgi:FAD:protein FMN transferase
MQNKPWDSSLELQINFELNAPAQGFYRRPYVAVWIEDKQGSPVRTLELWYQQGRGVRWLRHLTAWMRGEQLRKLADGGDLSVTASSPTRNPGRYTVVWDGKDDQKKPVSQGEYAISIEVSQEHGPYQLLRKSIPLTNKSLKADLGANVQIKSASIELRKKR